jgi:pimeloyl-ACP methyl ester carboxylesterase
VVATPLLHSGAAHSCGAVLSGEGFERGHPEARYAKTSDGVYIAYQVLGDGPMDLLYLPGYTSNLFWQWELPSYARFLEQLASFSRLILVDRRGTGLSDRFSPQDLPPLEDLADDLEIVMDAVGSERIALLGTEDGCFVCSMFAATHPGADRRDRAVRDARRPRSRTGRLQGRGLRHGRRALGYARLRSMGHEGVAPFTCR